MTGFKRLVSLTSVPTPYRAHFYEHLTQALDARQIQSQVLYMAWSERGRNWTFTKADLPDQSFVLPGTHLYFKERVFHFNPTILRFLLKNPPDWILMSGSWFMPTNQIAVLIKKFTKTQILFWSESNLLYVEHGSAMPARWRKLTMDQYDAFVVPGQLARDYVLRWTPSAASKPILTLANIVDETHFRDDVANYRACYLDQLYAKWHIDRQQTVLLIIARLAPIKGVEEFLNAMLHFKQRPEITVLVAGDGPQRDQLEQLVRAHGGKAQLRLIGYQPQEAILELLAIADAFVLPSIGDPYPLSVIEAMFAGLPLLLSDLVGCHPETLFPGETGFLFDPRDPESIQNAVRQFMALTPAQRAHMRDRSRALAQERFATQAVIDHFVEDLLALSGDRGT